jgi:Rps23 Pro-64 3,4-dihydroxylase Tpa1-like proline 4-hydroxylase
MIRKRKHSESEDDGESDKENHPQTPNKIQKKNSHLNSSILLPFGNDETPENETTPTSIQNNKIVLLKQLLKFIPGIQANEILLSVSKEQKYRVKELDILVTIKNSVSFDFPIEEKEAEKLIKHCNMFKDRNENETTFKSSGVFELDPQNSVIEKSIIFNQLIAEVARMIPCKHMGSQYKLVPQYERFLIQTPGSYITKHQANNNSNESDDMRVATLFVQIPSVFTGGEIVVYENDDDNSNVTRNKSKKYDFSCQSIQNEEGKSINYLIFYSDLQYEILRIKSGYRALFVYSLHIPCTINHILTDYIRPGTDLKAKLKSILWDLTIFNKKIGIQLEENYAKVNFNKKGESGLKAIDKMRLDLVKQANQSLPKDDQFDITIVHFKMTTHSMPTNKTNNNSRWEEYKRTESIHKW